MAHDELKPLSKTPGVSIVIVCFTTNHAFSYYYGLGNRKQGSYDIYNDQRLRNYARTQYKYRFPELKWNPIHRLVINTPTASLEDDKFEQLPILHRSILGLIRNPDFNRFEHVKALLPETDFPASVSNLTLYFFAHLDILSRRDRYGTRTDIDAILQVMVFLKHKLLKLHGTKFYVVQRPWQGDVLHPFPSTVLYQRLGFEVIKYDTTFTAKKKVFLIDAELDLPYLHDIREKPFSIAYDSQRPSYSERFHPSYNADVKMLFTHNAYLLTDETLKLWMKTITSIAKQYS